jgi:hypothetical protein
MAREVFGLAAYDLAEPFPDFRAVDVIVIDPVLVAGIIRGVNIDALHLPGVIGQQCLKGFEVVALDKQIAAVRISNREFWIALQEPKRHLVMVVLDSLPPYPVKSRHMYRKSSSALSARNLKIITHSTGENLS